MACLSQESLLVSPSLTGHKVVCLQSLFMLGPGLQPLASTHPHSDRFSQQRSTGSGKCPLWSELAPPEQTHFLCRDPPLPLSSGQQGRVLNPGPHRSSPLLSPHREIRVLERGVSDSLPHDGFSTGTHSPLGCGGWGWKRHSLFRPPGHALWHALLLDHPKLLPEFLSEPALGEGPGSPGRKNDLQAPSRVGNETYQARRWGRASWSLRAEVYKQQGRRRELLTSPEVSNFRGGF